MKIQTFTNANTFYLIPTFYIKEDCDYSLNFTWLHFGVCVEIIKCK